jgi:hypothetical protein
MKTVKITWDEVSHKIAEIYGLKNVKFMKKYGLEADSEMYELPDYIEGEEAL